MYTSTVKNWYNVRVSMKERTRQERKTLCVPGYRPAVAPLPVGRWNLIGGRVIEQDIQFCSLGVIQGQHDPHRGHWAVTGAVHWPLGAGCEQRSGDSLVWTVIESAARSGHRILCPVQCTVQTTKGVHYIRCALHKVYRWVKDILQQITFIFIWWWWHTFTFDILLRCTL